MFVFFVCLHIHEVLAPLWAHSVGSSRLRVQIALGLVDTWAIAVTKAVPHDGCSQGSARASPDGYELSGNH